MGTGNTMFSLLGEKYKKYGIGKEARERDDLNATYLSLTHTKK
jgi:hypothetical protein